MLKKIYKIGDPVYYHNRFGDTIPTIILDIDYNTRRALLKNTLLRPGQDNKAFWVSIKNIELQSEAA